MELALSFKPCPKNTLMVGQSLIARSSSTINQLSMCFTIPSFFATFANHPHTWKFTAMLESQHEHYQVVGGCLIHSSSIQKIHTGAVMTLGRGAVYSTSMQQKLNGQSSMEAKLIGVSDALPQMLWTQNFLEAQGYPIKESIVYQDNQSAILLKKMEWASSSE